MKFTIAPDTPFSLAAAAAFGFGPKAGRPTPVAGEMRLAFVTDDMKHHAGVHLTQDASGLITATVDTDADPEVARRQVCRVLSPDHPGADWAQVGVHDPVIGGLQREPEGEPTRRYAPSAPVAASCNPRPNAVRANTLRQAGS